MRAAMDFIGPMQYIDGDWMDDLDAEYAKRRHAELDAGMYTAMSTWAAEELVERAVDAALNVLLSPATSPAAACAQCRACARC